MTQAAQPFHSVYVQRRQPGVSRADFQRLWRSHGDFAAGVPAFWNNVERYVHNDPVEPVAGVPAATADYDAVGELYYTSYASWLGMRDVMWHEVAPDEKRVFAGPPGVSVRGERTVHQVPQGACKLFTFANLKPGPDPAALAKHAAMTLALPGFGARLAGFTITQALRPTAASGMDQVAQTASSHDAVFIHHFADRAAAQAALTSADYARLAVAEDALLDWSSRVVILTTGWVLKGQLG